MAIVTGIDLGHPEPGRTHPVPRRFRLAAWASVTALLLAQAGPASAATTVERCGGCFVNVLLNGTTAGSKGVKSVVTDGGGGFIITFARPVTGCAFTATLFNGFAPAFPIILTSSIRPKQINLHSSDASGGIKPAQYSVVVTC